MFKEEEEEAKEDTQQSRSQEQRELRYTHSVSWLYGRFFYPSSLLFGPHNK